MLTKRVVITGLGMVSPVGNNVADSWRNILAGKSGIAPITQFDCSEFSVRFGGGIKDFDPGDAIPRKDLKKMDIFIQYAVVAANEAIQDAGLPEMQGLDVNRVGVAIGSGIGGLAGIEQSYGQFLKGGPRKYSPFFIPSCIINMAAGYVSIYHGYKGPNFSMVSACTTGTHNIGEAARMIKYGDADVVVAGGTEMATTPSGLGGFAAARALSTRNDDPEAASRPWDKDRDGFVLSDGAGVMVLESLEHAKARGAKIYAEVSGYGMSGDGYHITKPSEGGEGAVRCMQAALKDAGLNPDTVDYINAHGTSTPAGDIAETEAIKTVFGDHAYKLVVNSTKSMTGHMLGATGGVEAIFSALAVHEQVSPPTINLENPDPACDLDYVAHTAREMKIDVALSNSFGFGGTNATLILTRFNG
ncbi:MAG: beta-ketoacyl-[acyl-carrier-protein] synthase II [Gammaproteobacteria bacterium]|nr:MAG: beta-ketoacyl-[acyl-carrier-protein] synthase II [Gammaproteobacteria bacterium]